MTTQGDPWSEYARLGNGEVKSGAKTPVSRRNHRSGRPSRDGHGPKWRELAHKSPECHDTQHGEESYDEVSSPDVAGISDDEFQKYRNRIESLERELKSRRTEQAALLSTVDELEDLLSAKTKEFADVAGSQKLTVGVELGKPDGVEMTVVAGMAGNKRPKFVEVDRHGFIIHPERTTFLLQELQDVKSPLNEFLKKADETRDSEYLLFLVKPEGIAAFDEIHRHMRKTYPSNDGLTRVGMGWEPFSDAWLLLSKQPKQ